MSISHDKLSNRIRSQLNCPGSVMPMTTVLGQIRRGAAALVLSATLAGGLNVVPSCAPCLAAPSDNQKLEWQEFSPAVFARARAEHKFVLLDLEAVWCHWCHVMAEETYKDSAVVKLLQSKFICVRVDQDARPDLSNKYEQYGWPATIVFDDEGRELSKTAGYINPQNMKNMLGNIASGKASKPISEPERLILDGGDRNFRSLSSDNRQSLIKRHKAGWDAKNGAWGKFQKYLDFDSAELAMVLGLGGDKDEALQACGALDAELALLDPAFGGLYQYSTDGDWQHPHFEKVMAVQADGIRLYCLGYMVYGDKKYLHAAEAIGQYLIDYLSSPEGAFYTSQDADLKAGEHSAEYFALDKQARLNRGLPAVDQHIYSRENGLAASAFTYLYRATGDRKYLDRAREAVAWIVQNRSITGEPGGFRHDQVDRAGPYLSDTLAMARAFLNLYEVTGDRSYLEQAKLSDKFIDEHFGKSDHQGFLTAVQPPSEGSGSKGRLPALAPQGLLDENVMMARFVNLLYQYTGSANYSRQGRQALYFLSLPETLSQRKTFVGGILLADGEVKMSPLHVTVVGGKEDAAAEGLFAAAIKLPVTYKRTEWFDRKEGPLPNMDVELPELPKAAAFCCGEGRCSRPAFNAEELGKIVSRLTNQTIGVADDKQVEQAGFDQSYKSYGLALAKFVEGDTGLVHYRQWQADQSDLTKFLDEVASLDKGEYEKFDRMQKLAFWLNVYNALAIKSILEHYPVKATVDYFPKDSIRQFNDGWEALKFTVMGQPITLYDIEHDRLRLGFRDPRVHFAVESGSMDSAPLSKKPYTAEGLDSRLDIAARDFFLRPTAFSFDKAKNQVLVSKLFNWFTLDFACNAGFDKAVFPPPKDEDVILAYVLKYLPADNAQALKKAKDCGSLSFDYLPFNWALNDAH
jgi:uncharacterized protein YyaL (SSP411 family)